MFYLPLSLFNFISLLNFFYSLLHNFIIFPPQCFYSLLHNFYYFPSSMFLIPLLLLHLHLLISIVFSSPPPPPHFYCFSSTTTPITTFLLFSPHHHLHRHISIVFPLPPPPPPHFYCFPSTTTSTTTTATFLEFSLDDHHYRHISIVFSSSSSSSTSSSFLLFFHKSPKRQKSGLKGLKDQAWRDHYQITNNVGSNTRSARLKCFTSTRSQQSVYSKIRHSNEVQSIDSCQTTASADQHHLTVSRAQVSAH